MKKWILIKIVKNLEESGLLIKGIDKAYKQRQRNKKAEFLACNKVTLCASLWGNLWTDKAVMRSGEGSVRIDQDF